ncbi:MAG: iron-sulfur cluster assembly scaffold protein [Verrucomicrobiota bacterium]
MSDLNQKVQNALANPKNLGEMSDADSIGTAGSEGCGDMLRMWVKFKQDATGRKVIDRATFQTFGCETAIAVASVATELVAGKTIEEALHLSSSDLAAPLGALPPMKIHCAQLVETALRSALEPNSAEAAPHQPTATVPPNATPVLSPSLRDSFTPQNGPAHKVRVILKTPASS